MAITTICSSPTHSPTLPTISSLKTHHPLQPQLHASTSSTKFDSNIVSNDALVIAAALEAVTLAQAAALEAVTLAQAAAQAARNAVLAAAEIGEVWSGRESDNVLVGDGNGGFGVRRKRRRKRRRGLEEKIGESWRISSGSVKSGKSSPREEAEFCLCLKVGLLVKF